MDATMKIDNAPFWLVWNPQGHSPQYQHSSTHSAEAEAKRLARNNPGQEFYVLAPIAKLVKQDVEETRYKLDEIPF